MPYLLTTYSQFLIHLLAVFCTNCNDKYREQMCLKDAKKGSCIKLKCQSVKLNSINDRFFSFFVSDQRRTGQFFQLGLLCPTHRDWIIFYAQSCSWCLKRVSPTFSSSSCSCSLGSVTFGQKSLEQKETKAKVIMNLLSTVNECKWESRCSYLRGWLWLLFVVWLYYCNKI